MKRITPIYIVEMKSLEWDDAAWNIIVAYDNEIDALAMLESKRHSDLRYGDSDAYDYRIRYADLLATI